MPIEDAAMMQGNGGFDQIAPECAQPRKRPLLVGTGKLAVSDHIGRKNGWEFPGFRHGRPSPHARLARLLVGLDRLFRLDDDCSPAGIRTATMDIAGWLRSLGLEQYEPAFRENHVDETVLPNLTVEDLKDLGVGSIGHPRKLLEAIALLRDAADAKAPARGWASA
jgi:hypothetical protein